jgi:ribosomal protein S27E
MAVNFNVLTEIVTGNCPTCQNKTLLVNIGFAAFRCVTCGDILEQKVNGVIKYMKVNKDTKFEAPSSTVHD